MTVPGRGAQLDEVLSALMRRSPEIEAAAVVSFDGLSMASALPPEMDESRLAAMSAALLSLGERAAEGLGRGDLSQVYIEGAEGTVFLVSADGEAVLVAVAAAAAKPGLVLYELRRAAVTLGQTLRDEFEDASPAPVVAGAPAVPEPVQVPVAAAAVGNGHGSLDSGQRLPSWPPAPGADGPAPSWS